MFIAEPILEGHNIAPPVDCRVMLLEPVYPKDDGMVLDTGNVQGHGFMVVSYGKGDLNMVCDRSVQACMAIGHVESDRMFKGGGGEIVVIGEGRVDKGFLCS